MDFILKIYTELHRVYLAILNLFLKPYSRLYIVSDNAGWVLDEEAKELKKIAASLKYKAEIVKKVDLNIPQMIHYTSQFSLLSPKIYNSRNKISIDYFHGQPDQGENFLKCFKALKNHPEIAAIRVSNEKMRKSLINYGVPAEKIIVIPIGINSKIFTPRTEDKKNLSRKKIGIPLDAFAIGSFQKDGVGWGDGNEPKLIKGPDVFISAIEKLKTQIPNLFVLLSGPSRGYVKKELERIGVPYTHCYPRDYKDISSLYDGIDLYIISSREEGGPKACLESLAKGIPLVTTEVGQCRDIIKNKINGMMVPVEDVDGIVSSVLEIMNSFDLRKKIVENGLETAAENSYKSQLPLWNKYFQLLNLT